MVPGLPGAIAVRPDGRIVAALDTAVYGRVEAAQLRPDGAPDPSFGVGGVAVVSQGYGSATNAPFSYAAASALALEPDGALVVAGTGLPSPGEYGYLDWFLQRLTPTGTPAGSGSSPGFLDFDHACFTEVVDAIAPQPDGNLVAVGDACEGDEAPAKLFVARYTPRLALDTGPPLTLTGTQAATATDAVQGRVATVRVRARVEASAPALVSARVRAPLRLLPGSSIGGTRLGHAAAAISTRAAGWQSLAVLLVFPRRLLARHRTYKLELTAIDARGRHASLTLHFTAPRSPTSER